MRIKRTAVLAAILAMASGQAALPQTATTPAAKPITAPPPPDPCAPSQYAKDDYFPTPAFPGQTRAARPAQTAPFKVETFAHGLDRPIALAFLGDGRILVSSAPSLRLIDKDGKLSPPIAGGPAALDTYDFALDRDFKTNRTIYFIYRAPDPAEVVPEGRRPTGIGRVARARISADWTRLEDVKVILEGFYPRRILQTADGRLLVSTMDATGATAQKLDQLSGKILRINGGTTAQPGLEQPVYFWDPDIAPSGLVVYRGAMFPAWKGDIFIAALVGKTLVRLAMKDGKVTGEEPVLSGRCERYRDVAQGPDGALYVLTDGPAATVLRVSRP